MADGHGGGATKDGGMPPAFAGVFRPTKWMSVLLIIAGAGLWCFSLKLPVFVTSSGAVDWAGKDILFMGMFAIPFIILLPDSWGWFANPVMLAAVIFLLGGWKKGAFVAGSSAAFLAQTAWLAFHFGVISDEDGNAKNYLSASSTGFFVWDAGLVLMFVGLVVWIRYGTAQQTV